jgi:phosphatidylserine synthase
MDCALPLNMSVVICSTYCLGLHNLSIGTEGEKYFPGTDSHARLTFLASVLLKPFEKQYTALTGVG